MSNIRQIDEKEQSRTLNDEKKDTRDRAKEEFGRIAKMWDFFLCDGEDGLFFQTYNSLGVLDKDIYYLFYFSPRLWRFQVV